jgi:hypothetical protein
VTAAGGVAFLARNAADVLGEIRTAIGTTIHTTIGGEIG